MTTREAVFTFPDSDERLLGELRIADDGAPHVLLQGEGATLEKAQESLAAGGVLHGDAPFKDHTVESFADQLTGRFTVFGGTLSRRYWISSESMTQIELDPPLVLFGEHLTSPPETMLCSLDINTLPVFLPTEDIEVDIQDLEELEVEGWNLKTPRWSSTIELESAEMTVWTDWRYSQTLDELHFDRNSGFQLKSPLPLSTEQWVKQFNEPLEALFTLLLDQPAVTTRMSLKQKPRGGARPLRVVTRGVDLAAYRYLNRPGRVLISPLLRIGEDVPFDVLMRRWFELWDTHTDVITLLQASLRGLDLTPELALVAAVQVVEGFHRGSDFDQAVRSESEHDVLMTALDGLEVTRAEVKWLKERVQWNEPSARRRLKDLARPVMEEPLGLMLGDKHRLDRFISIAIDTRNAITHRLPPGNSNVWTDDLGLRVLAEGLLLIVTCHLLHALGLSFDQQHERLRKNPRFRFSQDWFQPLLYEREGDR